MRVQRDQVFRYFLSIRFRWIISGSLPLLLTLIPQAFAAPQGAREFTLQTLIKIASPVLTSAARGTLPGDLPSHHFERNRRKFTYLEAIARTLAGIAPWLELGPDPSPEGQERERFIKLSLQTIIRTTDPKEPQFLNFGRSRQPVVEISFLAYALLRAPTQLWGRLSPPQQANVIAVLKSTRIIPPNDDNWLMFSAMVEATLWEFTGRCERERIAHAVKQHLKFYVGDGVYGDGAEFHWDYYNSFVVQPMLLQVLRTAQKKGDPIGESYQLTLARAKRYAEIQERLISPEGTIPIIGRSASYRFAALQHLANMALLRELPHGLSHGGVRAGLTAVIRRMSEAPGTFDSKGWLQVGVVGRQPSVREHYISTGSLYLCLAGLVHLGLPTNDPFWQVADEPWTQKRLWSGENVLRDRPLNE